MFKVLIRRRVFHETVTRLLIFLVFPAFAWAGGGKMADTTDCYNEIDPYYRAVDVASLVHVHSPADAVSVRRDIIDYLWSGGLPETRMPETVQSLDINMPLSIPEWIIILGSENLGAVKRLDIGMDFDMHSYAYLLRPVESNNRLLIWHQGHHDDILAFGGKEMMRYFLDRGFSIITLWMPLFGENNRTARDIPGYGNHTFPESYPHDQMSFLENRGGSFIRFFMEPVVVAINYIEENYDYNDIHMVGLSGGGWTTHLAAAIDPRIRYSFAVAGSLPLYCRRGPCPNGSLGDAEQWWPPLYEHVASWLDIYILAAWGKGRRHVHILNQFDSCCFGGILYRTFEPYVRAAVGELGQGSYSIFLDSSHNDHKISETVLTGVIGKLLLTEAAGTAQ